MAPLSQALPNLALALGLVSQLAQVSVVLLALVVVVVALQRSQVGRGLADTSRSVHRGSRPTPTSRGSTR